MRSPLAPVGLVTVCLFACMLARGATEASGQKPESDQVIELRGDAGGRRFDGIGIVNGGGATSVLLKDYPEPQRSQILDLVFRPKFGASVSALLVEIPGDGNSTQGSMPSHMRTRDDLDYTRGYTWWILREAKTRNPALSLDGAAWSAPGWIGEDPGARFTRDHRNGDAAFWSPDAVDYYVKWLQGLRSVHGLALDAMGCRNEKGVSLEFVKHLRAALDANGFAGVRLHAFDNWPDDKFDFVAGMIDDPEARAAIDVIGAHVMYGKAGGHASPEVQALVAQMGKPIWNTEDHVYKKGFDCALGIVECFNDNFIHSGATRIVNWYDIAGVYGMEPYSEDPAMILAHWPWSGHYRVREALWGYAHYGQFTEIGWEYLNGGCGELAGGGSFVTLKSPGSDYSIIIETKDATARQPVLFRVGGGLSSNALCVWRSDARRQFIQQPSIEPMDGSFTLTLEPDAIYSLSTTTGQRKGGFVDIPAPRRFPFPHRETFEGYERPAESGHLPRYFADIEEVFELTDRPDGQGRALRQVIPVRPISWAPSWQPYSIIGDETWSDYEVSVDVWLNAGDTAGVMGRVCHVGAGYGTIPKGYFLKLASDGTCELVVVRGKKDKKKLVGDAEQQALIKAKVEDDEGGEKVLASIRLDGIGPGRWYKLGLRFDGTAIAGLVDGEVVVSVEDALYAGGMAGILAGTREGRALSTPWFDNVVIKAVGSADPESSKAAPSQTLIYADPVPNAVSAMAAPSNPAPTLADMPYGEHERQVLGFWKAPADEPTPVLVHFHGGGWMQGDKSSVRDVARYLAAGISVVSVNYRYVWQAQEAGVNPPVEWPMHDGARALQFVRAHAEAWGIDRARIAVSGNSAGACTALWLALHDDMADPASDDPIARESTRVWCAAVDSAQTSLDPRQMRTWTPNSRYGGHAFGFDDPSALKAREAIFEAFLARRQELLPWIVAYSPIEHASADDPPVYLIYRAAPALGQPQQDPTYSANFGVALAERLRSLGVSCELSYPGAPGASRESIFAYLVARLEE